MQLKLLNDRVDEEEVFGPFPNLNESFENFFLRKAFLLIYGQSKSNPNNSPDVNSEFKQPVKYTVSLKKIVKQYAY